MRWVRREKIRATLPVAKRFPHVSAQTFRIRSLLRFFMVLK